MPAFFGWLATALVGLVGPVVARVFVALGLAVVYYKGFDVLLEWFETQVWAQFDAMPAQAIQIVGVLQIATCVKILFTAMAIRVTLLGLAGGFKRLVLM